MKLLDFDWRSAFAYLETWESVSPASRRLLQDGESHSSFGLALLGEDGQRFCRAGILKAQENGRAATAEPRARPFLSMVRLLRRVPLLSDPSPEMLLRFLGEVLTSEERVRLTRSTYSIYGYEHNLVRSVASRAWVDDFFAAKDLAHWEGERGHEAHDFLHSQSAKPSRFAPEGVAVAARAILTGLMERPQPVPLRQITELAERSSADEVAQAVVALVRYALAFPAERPKDGTVVLTLWPSISARLHREPARPPREVTCDGATSTVHGAEDLAALLASAAREPLRLRASDGRVFERRAQDIQSQLASQPEWVERAPAGARDAGSWRIARAHEVAHSLDWLELRDEHHQPHDVITASGREWLGRSAGERLRILHDALRSAAAEAGDDPGSGRSDLLPLLGGYSLGFESEETLRAHARSAFESLEPGRFVDLGEFLHHRAEVCNPLTDRKKQRRREQDGQSRSVEELELFWQQALLATLFDRLVPYGAATAGEHGPDRRPCFRMNPSAAYLFGSTNDWMFVDVEEGARVIVQPNFEIVFVRPAPALEAQVLAFAVRAGVGTTARYRITCDSVYSAAAAGLKAEDILRTLSEISLNALPSNVVSEVRTWAARSMNLECEQTHVVRCPDAETALRVLSAAGRCARLLGDSVVEIVDQDEVAAVLRKLRKDGLFVNPPARMGTKRRRRQRT